MSKFKVGDKVRRTDSSFDSAEFGKKGDEGIVTGITGSGSLQIEWTNRKGSTKDAQAVSFELIAPEPVKGTFLTLAIEGLPQGGYKVTVPQHNFGSRDQELAAFSTLPEAVAFVGRNMA